MAAGAGGGLAPAQRHGDAPATEHADIQRQTRAELMRELGRLELRLLLDDTADVWMYQRLEKLRRALGHAA